MCWDREAFQPTSHAIRCEDRRCIVGGLTEDLVVSRDELFKMKGNFMSYFSRGLYT